MIPNFLFIGPSRTGSTWIFELLRSHPQICVPIAKDIYFFDQFYHKGRQWYLKKFSSCSPQKIAGEVSHDYFSNSSAIDRIWAYNPKMKLICCLRDPFERAWSSYKFLQRNGLASKDFMKETGSYPELINESLYYTHLSHILSVFDRSKLLILFFADLRCHPKYFARQIYTFLGVNQDYDSPVIEKIINQSARPRSKKLAKIIKSTAAGVRKWGFPEIVGCFKRNPLILKVLYQEIGQSDTRQDIISHFSHVLVDKFNAEIDQLGYTLNMDLKRWKALR